MIELHTNSSILYYFAPDDEQDIPRYAIQSNKQKLYEKFIPLIPEDKLSVQASEDGKLLSLALQGYSLGSIDIKDKDKIDKFLKIWNDGLQFLKTKELKYKEFEEVEIADQNSLQLHLKERESEFLHEGKLKLRFVSWNLHGDELFKSKNDDISELFLKDGVDLDIYFVSFQETVPLSAKNLRSSSVPIDKWSKKILDIIDPGASDKYKVLQTNKLLGLASILIIKSELFINFKDVEIDSIGTGIMNFYGNKGAILTNFKFNDFNFSFLDCHFAAGEKETFLVKRRKELHGVATYMPLVKSAGSLVGNVDESGVFFDVEELEGFMKNVDLESDEDDLDQEDEKTSEESSEDKGDDEAKEHKKEKDEKDEKVQKPEEEVNEEKEEKPEKQKLVRKPPPEENKEEEVESEEGGQYDFNKNIIFLGGDLNYRISSDPETVKKLIKSKDYKELLSMDTLSMEKEKGRILKNFEEGTITFPPTYKFDLTSKDYDNERIPSYTDRIFHSKSDYVSIDSYSSPEIYLSDHKPVIKDFTINKISVVNNDERNSIVKSYLKKLDDAENYSKKPSITIESLENVMEIPSLTNSTMEIKINNIGNCKLYWEIIDSVEHQETKFPDRPVTSKIEQKKGIMPKHSSQILKINTTLPIGCSKFEKTLVLRVYKLQDFFITCTFIAKKSYFGCSIDELNGDAHTGIPKPIYTLINYLNSRIINDMFDETKLNFTHELEKRIIRLIDNDNELDAEDLKQADRSIDGSSSRAVARVLLLLLRNLDGGIVSSDLSTYLLTNFEKSHDVLERVLESLPPLRANVLIYLSSFLRLCIENGINREEIYAKFANLLIEVPKMRKRDFMLNRTNYEKLRKEFLEKLI